MSASLECMHSIRILHSHALHPLPVNAYYISTILLCSAPLGQITASLVSPPLIVFRVHTQHLFLLCCDSSTRPIASSDDDDRNRNRLTRITIYLYPPVSRQAPPFCIAQYRRRYTHHHSTLPLTSISTPSVAHSVAYIHMYYPVPRTIPEPPLLARHLAFLKSSSSLRARPTIEPRVIEIVCALFPYTLPLFPLALRLRLPLARALSLRALCAVSRSSPLPVLADADADASQYPAADRRHLFICSRPASVVECHATGRAEQVIVKGTPFVKASKYCDGHTRKRERCQ
ncbi:hypothetical protein R3P38DRAFT_1669879 [Favolaschia claudopus]|uniref:Uncharacterized protein n=1 Tax=Favolaschia claudopus TaxID=2862362 RepID=A0AAW0ADX0_9AGAR